MRVLLKENVVEALVGLIVVLVAAFFVNFAWERTQAGRGGDGIDHGDHLIGAEPIVIDGNCDIAHAAGPGRGFDHGAAGLTGGLIVGAVVDDGGKALRRKA